jgi:hypothetical protein
MVLVCWNHTRGDFKYHLKQIRCPPDNLKVHLDQLKIMLACDSEEKFLDCSMSITSKWSEPAVSYFEPQLKSDIIKYAGKWLLEEFDGQIIRGATNLL